MPSNIEHVAIIMDGNGRWAVKRRRPRLWGHIRGSRKVSEIVEAACDLKQIKSLTLYAFSTENWNRPSKEITTLFFLLYKYLKSEKDRIQRNNICFKVIGNTSGLPAATRNAIFELESISRNATGLRLNFAFDYGGRTEIVQAVNEHIRRFPGQPVDEDILSGNLLTQDIGNVDLLIRTGGDKRISNFLLWQIAYAELFFTDTYWPDFSAEEFRGIYKVVMERERRFGGVGEDIDYNLSVSRSREKRNQGVILASDLA